jgi:ATP-dependent DNA helicase RecG
MSKEAGVIEKYGSGIARIRTAMLKAGCPEPRFEGIVEGFRVTLMSPPSYPPSYPLVAPLVAP